jgi:predicted nucleic acid-binding protein
MIAVSDTGPLLYLSLIDCIDLLPQIFEKVLIPRAVAEELSDPSAPSEASYWIAHRPEWLHIWVVPPIDLPSQRLGPGEREAIALTNSSGADVLLMDDHAARNMARQTVGIAVSGTIGVLYRAALDDSVVFTATNFDECIARLLATNFRSDIRLRNSIEALSRELHNRAGAHDRDR